MKDNNRIGSINYGKTLGIATPKKEPHKKPIPITDGKGLGKATPVKR